MFSLTYFLQKQELEVFIFLLDETEMAQNNSLFVWKTSNYSLGRSNLRNDMKNVTNLKSLGFTWKRIAKLLGVFPEVVLCNIDFSGFFDVAFDPHISSIAHLVVDCVAKLVLSVATTSVAQADDSPATTLSSLLWPLLPLHIILGNSLPNSCVTDGYWFSSISHFAKFTKSISDCTIFFDCTISRVMHWQLAAFTVLMNWLLGRFVSRQKTSQTY